MYLVTVLKTEIQTNAFPVNLVNDGLAGMMPVFKRKRDAIRHAKKLNAQVLEVAPVNQPPHITTED